MTIEGVEYNLDSQLGIACDPWGTDDNFNLYIAHSKIFQNGGKGPKPGELEMPYLGHVSYLNSAENFKEVHTVISGLPVSDHDHSVNGIQFGNDGTLYISVGG